MYKARFPSEFFLYYAQTLPTVFFIKHMIALYTKNNSKRWWVWQRKAYFDIFLSIIISLHGPQDLTSGLGILEGYSISKNC